MSTNNNSLIRILPGESYTPFALAKKLNAKVLLESSSFTKGRERYSLLLVREAFLLEQTDKGVYMSFEGGAVGAGAPGAGGNGAGNGGRTRKRVRSKARDILDVQRYFADQHTQPHQDFPYPAGGVGFLSYEFAQFCDSLSFRDKPDPLGLPLAAFLFGHVFVVFDHYTDLLYLLGMNYREHEVNLPAVLDEVESSITDLNFNYLQHTEEQYTTVSQEEPEARTRFCAGVERLKDEIRRGNLLQGVLSRRLYVETELPALEAYRRLRTANPSPYLFYLNFGEYEMFGSSPEVHIKVRDNEVCIRPIAGTRRRGESREQDIALEKELLADPKERAEHLMLVDLARNDIGRVCRSGSVAVGEYMTIEMYSHVMHIVSEARGQLDTGKSGIDAIRATFPAGTVSGAPKISAMQKLDELEPEARRFYAGLVGYLEPGGNLDTCITIRSALKKDGKMVLQAGAGVVYDSVPEREWEETGEKLGALARAVGLEVNA